MNFKFKSFYYKVWIYLPILILIGIITFLYVVYSATFLIPLLNNDYAYDKSITTADATQPTFLLTMKKVTLYANVFVETMRPGATNTNTGMPSEEEKGWIYFAFLHVFLLIMLTGFVRTVVTDPGRVPPDWNKKQDETVQMYRRQANADARTAILKTEPLIRRHIKFSSKGARDVVLDAQREIGTPESAKSKVSKHTDAQLQAEEKSPLINSGIQSGEANIETAVDLKIDDMTPGNPGGDEVLSERAFQEKYGYDTQKEAENIFSRLMQENSVRMCNHCNQNKPERTHHCRQCNACTLRMDHHCPWVNNCVGFYNYKYFMIMLIYSVLALWFLVFTYTEVVGDVILNYEVGTSMLFVIVLMYMLALTLATIVTLFLGFHFWLIYQGRTTLEHCEKAKKVRYGGGCWENYVAVFGTNYLLWPLPFGVNPEGKGVEFKMIPKNA